MQYIQPYSNWFYISSHIYSSLPLPLFNRAYWGKNLHWRLWIWLRLVAYLARTNAMKTIQNHQINIHDLPLAKTVYLWDTPINVICHNSTGTLLHCSHFEVLRAVITSLHSTWHTVRNLPAAQANGIQVMGHQGKHMTCAKVVMAGLKCCSLRSSQDKGWHLQVRREFLQDCREIIQSISQHLPARLLHLNLVPAYLGDTPQASRRKDCSRKRNRGKHMFQGLVTCPHCLRYPTTNMMQLTRATIHRTWAVQEANPQLAWSKRSFAWCNLPKAWGSPTSVHSRSGREYGWRGFSRRSIVTLPGGRTNSNNFEMDPWSGRQRSHIFLATFENWLPLVNFDNAEWICGQWVEMLLRKCAMQTWETRKKGRPGNKRLGMDLGERPGKKARTNLPELPNTIFTVMINWVLNGKDMVLAHEQLQASYTDVRHWQQLLHFIDKNGGPKEPYILISIF